MFQNVLLFPSSGTLLHHSPGMRVMLRWVHEVGSTSSKYGASNLPYEVYYCNFLFFIHGLLCTGEVMCEVQCKVQHSEVLYEVKNKTWWGGYPTVSQNSSPYFPLHLLHISTSTQFSKWQCSRATYKPCYLSAFLIFIKAVQKYGIIL